MSDAGINKEDNIENESNSLEGKEIISGDKDISSPLDYQKQIEDLNKKIKEYEGRMTTFQNDIFTK